MVNFIPGYNSSKACATTWEVECQKAVFPSLSFQLYRTSVPSAINGVTVSTVVPLNFAEIIFRARPSLMLLATSKGVVPFAYSLTFPSGSVILIKIGRASCRERGRGEGD